MMKRLSNAQLTHLPNEVITPGYDRASVTPGILHLGIGAFHRAHQAVMVEDRLAAGERGWGIRAASLRAPDTRDALSPQDGLYTLAIRSGQVGVGDETRLRIIGAISDVLVARENPAALLTAMLDPRIRIVSLTVTEKGYCHDPATGNLNAAHPDVVHDLATPSTPVSAPGFIVEALRLRRASGVAPFTVMSCDNLPANGRTLARVITQMAALRDKNLADFIAGEVAFPATMVDRIVPATTEADRAMVAERLGVSDAWPVMSEPFTQWVMEDRFSHGRPRFEESGAELVADVAPYEMMKLRMLNGTHSTIAYLGQLMGVETVADFVTNPARARFIRTMMGEEIAPTVPGFTPAALEAYADALMARYANSALRHRTAQIAMDGSQKVPQRLLNTMRDRLAAGAPILRIGIALAAFCRFMTGTGEGGAPLPINDPMAARFAEAARDVGADGIARLPDAREAEALATRLSRAMLDITPVFGDLGADFRVVSAISTPLTTLYQHGAERLVAP
jgi:fructuronate reductase